MVAGELTREIEQFLYREARLLDDGRFAEWLDLFTDDAQYWVPARETRASRDEGVRKPGELPMFEDDKRFLVTRVKRLETELAHAEQPPSRTRHFVNNVEIVERGENEIEVHSNILVFQSRLERTEMFFVGKREDRLRKVDGNWLIARRKVILDQTLLPRSISIFF
jgi:3-phenylpropionate/cinnamic acid dioxygenase small subunit